jgi:hypothetical protein
MKAYTSTKYKITLLVSKDNGNGTFECLYFEGTNKSTLNLTQIEITEFTKNLR